MEIAKKLQAQPCTWQTKGDARYRLVPLLEHPFVKPMEQVILSTCGKNAGPFAILLKESGTVIGFEFTESEKLVLATSEGKIAVADLFTGHLQTSSLGNAVGVTVAVMVHKNTILLANSSDQVFIFDDLNNLGTVFPKILFKSAKVAENPKVVSDPHKNTLEIWSSHKSAGFYRTTQTACEHIKSLPGYAMGKVLKIAVTQQYRFQEPKIAMFCQNKGLETIILTPSFEEILKIPMGYDGNLPLDIVWCGRDAVASIYENRITLLDNAKSATFQLKADLVCAKSEIDGVRIYTKNSSIFIEKVQESIEKVYDEETGESAQYALEIYGKYLAMDPTLEEAFKNPLEDESTGMRPNDARSGCITTKLEAVSVLIKFAAREFDVEVQKYLIKAAEFSEVVVPHDMGIRQEMQQVIKHLLVLNEFRKVGRMITYAQFLEQTPEGLVEMALRQRAVFVAQKVVEMYKGRGKDLLANHLRGMSKKYSAKSVCEQKPNPAFQEYFKMVELWKSAKTPCKFVESALAVVTTNEIMKQWLSTYLNFYKHTKEATVAVFKGLENLLEDLKPDKSAIIKMSQVSERYAAMLRLKVLAQKNAWPEFVAYWESVKSKVLVAVVAKICAEHGNKELAVKLLQHIKNEEERNNAMMEIEVYNANDEEREEGQSSIMLNFAIKK